MNTIDELRDALHGPADGSAPDIPGLIARARRRRATRRAALGAVAAAVVITTIVVATPPKPEPLYVVAAGPTGVGTAPNPVLIAPAARQDTTTAPDRFDPLMRTLRVGWVPDHLVSGMAETSAGKQTFAATDEAYRDGGGDYGLVVTVLSKGHAVTDFADGALGLPREYVARRTTPIDGRAAECLADPAVPGSCAALRWQLTPGVWARVSYAGTAGPTPAAAAAVARRVAESVSLTAAEPVRVPFRLGPDLAGLRVAATQVSLYPHGTGLYGEQWSAHVQLVSDPRELDREWHDRRSVIVGALRRPGDPSGRIWTDPRINTTIDGHDARRAADGRAVIVWGVHGTRVELTYQNMPGDARARFADVRVLPDPADPAGWVSARS